jgi:biopolymer transport protein ExbD
MYRTPSSRKKKKQNGKLNLIPILDAVFIFIFFLLTSANFIKIYEIGSDVPIVSDSPPPKEDKKPLALVLKITDNALELYSGLPSRIVQTIKKTPEGEYNLVALHDYLIDLKKSHLNEDSIVMEPITDLEYEEIIKIMDAVRMINKTDDAIYKKGKDGLDEKVEILFNKIIFGNVMS